MIRGVILAVWVMYGICCLVAWEISEVNSWQHPNKIVARVNE